MLKKLLLASFLTTLAACGGSPDTTNSNSGNGSSSSSSSGAQVELSCGNDIKVGASPMRRLTHLEYRNSVRDLLNADFNPSQYFPLEAADELTDFVNYAGNQIVEATLTQSYFSAAEDLASDAVSNIDELVNCITKDEACAQQFINDFGLKAFRRPLSGEESQALLEVWQSASGNGADFDRGIQVSLTTILSSFSFLYKTETGNGKNAGPGLVELNPYEIAARMSFLIWGSVPDKSLLDAAANGNLSTAAQRQSQAQRMIADDRFTSTLQDFHSRWFSVIDLNSMQKLELELFDNHKALMKQEVNTFIADWFEDGGLLKNLFTSDKTFINDQLANYYSLPAPGSTELSEVSLPAHMATGILGKGATMAALAHAGQTDPIHRGVYVRERLMCQKLPDIPPGLMVDPPMIDPTKTTRERFHAHRLLGSSCFECHRLLDDIGFVFESYDELGRYRDKENDLPIDTSGEMIESLDMDGPITDLVDLATRMSNSEEVARCAAKQWFQYAYGRPYLDADACAVESLYQKLEQNSGSTRELLLALIASDEFIVMNVPVQ